MHPTRPHGAVTVECTSCGHDPLGKPMRTLTTKADRIEQIAAEHGWRRRPDGSWACDRHRSPVAALTAGQATSYQEDRDG